MSYRHTLEAALESLHEIEDMVKGFPVNGNIPAIEIDLTLQKLRNIYELMLMMRRPEEAPAEEKKVATATVVKEKKTAKVASVTVVESAPAPFSSHSPAKEPGSLKENQMLADQFKGRTTLHESLHQTFTKEGDTLAHAKPVTDLLTAIGINDRFTFVRELFKDDTAAFESSIKILNDAASFNDAYNYMIQHFDWDMDSETVQLLLDKVRRKFIKGRHE
jgi:hypothetical protein